LRNPRKVQPHQLHFHTRSQHRKDRGRQARIFGIAFPGKRRTSTATPSRLQRLNAIFQLRLARGARAVDAAEDFSVSFNAVSDDSAVAMRANRRQRVDRALEAIEGVMLPANDDFKRLVIFIFANFACSHT